MILQITGKPGFGKTYTLTKFCIEHLQKFEKPVFSNVKINVQGFKNLKGDLYFWSELKQFKEIYDGLIIMDEAQTYFNAHRWKEMTEEDEIKLQQHRHHGLDIIGAVQDFNSTNTTLRRLTQEIIIVHKFFKFFISKQYEPQDYDLKTKKSLKTKIYKFDKKIANAYDTTELRKKRQTDLSQFKKMSDFFE